MVLSIHHYLVVSALLLALGIVTMVIKRNAIGILMGVELILNAGALNLVAFNAYAPPENIANPVRMDGQLFTLFVIVIAAAEAAVALAIFLNFYNNFASIDVEKGTALKG